MISARKVVQHEEMATNITSRFMGHARDTSVRQNAFVGMNLGRETFLMKIPLSQFSEISRVANERTMGAGEDVAQRPLDKAHAQRLAVYVLKGVVIGVRDAALAAGKKEKLVAACERALTLLGTQPYLALQPIVANLRDYDLSRLEEPNATVVNSANDFVCFRVPFGPGDLLFIVDGQHRLVAMQMVVEFLRYIVANQEYPKRNNLLGAVSGKPGPEDLQLWQECLQMSLTSSTVAVECHINLTSEEERQLFHDLNNLGKKVSAGMAFDFDVSNPINQFIKETLADEILSDWEVVERDVVDWDAGTVDAEKPQVARKDLVAINAILFRNKTNVKGARPQDVESFRETAKRFWRAVSEIDDLAEPDAKLKTVAAQPVVLKALARLTFEYAKGRGVSDEHLETLLEAIPQFDFSHENKLWRYYQMEEGPRKKEFPGLAAYLPPESEGNRDLGATDVFGRMRFGAKHNDIFPIIADMIRWKLKLPNRREAAAQ